MRQSTYALVLLAIVTPPYIYFYSVSELLFAFPILIISIYILTFLISSVQERNSDKVLRNLTILIFITGLLPFAINLLGERILKHTWPHFPVLITALFLPLAYYLFMVAMQVLRPSALDLVRSEELMAGEVLQDEVTKVVNNEFSQNLSHQWAIFIHGKILTRLAATSLKLESISQLGDEKSFMNTTQSLIDLLDAPDLEFEELPLDLQSQVISRLNPWVGLLDIDLHIDDELKLIETPQVRDLGQVIEELISNSIRHGKSKKMELKIYSVGANDVEIMASDDALLLPLKDEEKSGLGTRIFNLASDGRWSLKREGSSTIFRLTMGINS